MNTLNLEDKVRFKKFEIKKDFLIIRTQNNKFIKYHKNEIPFLKNATIKEISEYEILGDGEGVHWPLLDEDLSAAYLVYLNNM